MIMYDQSRASFILLNNLEQIAVYTINDFNFIAPSGGELSY